MNDKQLQEAAEKSPIAVPLSVKSGEDDWGKLRDKFFKECTYKASNLVSMPQHELSPHDLFEWFKRQFAIPTQSGEKKNKVLKSESIPEFDEGLKSLTQEQKDRVDRALGESMEDVLDSNGNTLASFNSQYQYEQVKQAMQRWASIQLSTKEAAIKDLVEVFESHEVKMVMEYELALLPKNSNGRIAYDKIQQLITKYKPTTP